jgi:hypothetical protein
MASPMPYMREEWPVESLPILGLRCMELYMAVNAEIS